MNPNDRSRWQMRPFAGELADSQQLENVRIEGRVFNGGRLRQLEAAHCEFVGCRFNDVHLDDCYFATCAFVNCDFSNAHVPGTRFDDVSFEDCKLIGINWGLSSRLVFDVAFIRCNLRYGSFRGMRLVGTSFVESAAIECSFAETKFKNALFRETDFLGAQFSQTDLRNADLRDAVNYVIDPRTSDLRGATISVVGAATIARIFGIEVEGF